ncbi:MAG: hypothetical protein H7Y00_11510 [Fimbriimonadaceae bacterium]|nr:hypothetical protein [Chitinophagales bacterium]
MQWFYRYKLYILLSCVFLANSISAQTKIEQITIEYADELEGIQQRGKEIKILRGNVFVSQDSVKLYCDSAFLNQTENIIKAFGHVHINQHDSIHTYSDSAKYNGNTKVAVLYENVKMTDNTSILTTDLLTYNLNSKIGTYQNGGKVDNGETVLTSEAGYYYANSDDAYFKDSVKLVHPEYKLEADTLKYNTAIDRAYFLGPTNIYNEKSKVYCEDGYYDSKTGLAVFNKNVKLDNPPQFVTADSIYYNRETGIGKAYRNVVFRDTAQNVLQYSNFGIYNEIDETIISTNGAIAAYIIEDDTLYIGGDTIFVKEDSLKKKTMVVYNNVKIYKNDIQGICDSLFYSDMDSTIRMYGLPVLWSDSTQFSSDTIFMVLKNKNLEQIELHTNGFIVNYLDSLIYNQLKGRTVYGYFKNDSLYKIHAIGNGESLYFAQDESKAYVGLNYTQCSEILIKIKQNKFSRVSFNLQPVAKFTPMQLASPSDFNLLNLNWEIDIAPQSKEDLLKPVERHQPIEIEEENPSEERSSQNDG